MAKQQGLLELGEGHAGFRAQVYFYAYVKDSVKKCFCFLK